MIRAFGLHNVILITITVTLLHTSVEIWCRLSSHAFFTNQLPDENMTTQSSETGAEQWSSWSLWKWSLSSGSSWWDSTSSQTLVLSTRRNTSSGRFVAATQTKERRIVFSDLLRIDNRRVTNRMACVPHTHTLTRTFSALQLADTHLTHRAQFSTKAVRSD